MSDKPEESKPVSVADVFAAFLHLKQMRIKCACGSTSFNAEHQVLLTHKFSLDAAGHVEVVHIPAIAAICAECYAIRFYAREPIDRYVTARKS